MRWWGSAAWCPDRIAGVVIDRRRRSLQDIVFPTRAVYSRPPAGRVTTLATSRGLSVRMKGAIAIGVRQSDRSSPHVATGAHVVAVRAPVACAAVATARNVSLGRWPGWRLLNVYISISVTVWSSWHVNSSEHFDAITVAPEVRPISGIDGVVGGSMCREQQPRKSPLCQRLRIR